MTSEQLNQTLVDVIDEARNVNIPVPYNIYPQVTINGRPKKRFGCCKRKEDGIEIEISKFVLDADDIAVKNVIAHEVLHSCPGCDNHGSIWKKYAAIMNYEYDYSIKRTSTFADLGLDKKDEPAPKIRYIMKCQKCGREYPRQRYTCVMKKINAYRCRCGGELKIYEVNGK